MTPWIPDLTLMAVAIPAVLLAGISKGGFGSGASFVAAPILALVVDPVLALGILLPLLMLIDLVALRSFWGRWHAPSTGAMILGGLPGVALGAWLSQTANPDVLRFLIGLIALSFVAWQLAGKWGGLRLRPVPFRRDIAGLTGIVAGFTSFVSHAGGPIVAVYLLALRLDKTTYQATTVVTFWVINIFKAIPYAVLGFFTAESLLLNLWLAPIAVLGAWMGIRAHHLVPERIFFVITYALLITTGSKLMWDAIT